MPFPRERSFGPEARQRPSKSVSESRVSGAASLLFLSEKSHLGDSPSRFKKRQEPALARGDSGLRIGFSFLARSQGKILLKGILPMLL